MNDEKNVAIRKYNAIHKANRVMFGAVAMASAIAGASLVGLGFIYQDIAFKSKVISEQDRTLANIKTSKDNISELAKELETLKSDDNLKSVMAGEDGNTLRPILDALPARANAVAIGSSLDNRILKVEGLKVEKTNVDPVADMEGGVADTSGGTNSGSNQNLNGSGSSQQTTPGAISSKVQSIGFSFDVVANAPEVAWEHQAGESEAEKKEAAKKERHKNNIKILTEVLENMEKSIRTFRVTSYKVEAGKDSLSMKISAVAYYLPEYSLTLTPKTINSDESAAKKTSSNNTTGGTK